jgi:Fe-Mn family superoxide dismutase
MYVLPKLDYAYSSLEPYIDAMTMEIHYTKHHQAYIDNLNVALKSYPELQSKSLHELLANLSSLPLDIKDAVQNNGGGHLNHSMFWNMMKPQGGGEPKGMIAEAIKKTFGNFASMQTQFNTAAKTRFGSGWAWLNIDKDGKLIINSTANQDTPISLGLTPILGLDVWEHAYYLKYQNRRVDYIAAWWHVVNWDYVEDRYKEIMK